MQREFIKKAITEHGFAVIAVADPAGSFLYTVGFTDMGFPEVIISGLRQDIAHHFLWDIYRTYREGKHYETNTHVVGLANLPTVFKTVTDNAAQEFCCQAIYWYEDKLRKPTFIQLVMPDRDGLFPWDEGFDAELMKAQRNLWTSIH